MIEVNVSEIEHNIALLGYDSSYPTRQQENLASVYVKMLYSVNGKGLHIEDGDVQTATSELNEVMSDPLVPVRYQQWLPAIVGVICEIITLTGSKSDIIKEIGVNAIDRLIDHAIRVLFDNLFAEEAPDGEQLGEIAEALDNLTEQVRQAKEVQMHTDTRIWDEGKGRIYDVGYGGIVVEGD